MAQDSSQPPAVLPHRAAPEPVSSQGVLPAAVSPIRAQDSAVPTPPARPMNDDPLNGYRVSAYSANILPPPDNRGLRTHAKRTYADIHDNGTVLVGYDEGVRAYRAKLRHELTPSGPVLRLNDDGETWNLAPHASPSPNTSTTGNTTTQTSLPGTTAIAPRVRIDITDYVWNPQANTHHGYVVLHRKKGLDEGSGPETHLAFQDVDGSFVKVEPSSSAIDQPADKLSAWTDRDLWDFYGLYGNEITRFREEAAATGMKPKWAVVRPERFEKLHLLGELRRWLAPRMSQDEFNRRMAPLDYSVGQWAAQLDRVRLDSVARRRLEVHKRKLDNLQTQTSVEAKRPRLAGEQAEMPAVPDYVTKSLENATLRASLIEHLRLRTSPGTAAKSLEDFTRHLQPYNLSTRQLSRLVGDLQADGRFPQWAEDHKRLSTDATNAHRLDEAYAELLPEIMNLRHYSTRHISFESSFTRPFLDDLLAKAGYKRNKNNCLYRTDIPAMFRGDDRTPFEFFNGHMLPRQDHVGGSTTQQAVSATFSLQEASGHARSVSEVEAILYDSQFHKYPGKPRNIFDPNNRDRDSGDENSSSSGDESDSSSDNSMQWNRDKNYFAKRVNQTTGFRYLFDTRNVEVVPGDENVSFNNHAQITNEAGTRANFPDDALEGHVSVSTRGLSADRIWLINSTGTRAAKVNDVCAVYMSQPEAAINPYSSKKSMPIEERTWSGVDNSHEYDYLIDQVANVNKPVINLSDKRTYSETLGSDVFSSDIVFP
jgi:hypothetical protein